MSPSPTGDTTYTKVFVGGLAWETQKESMNKYFEQFGDILEAVVISDKATGRSKGYGFVTFREAEAAMRACVDPAPVIDGRRANCNLASLGVHRSKPSTPNHGGGGNRNLRAFQAGFGGGATPFPSATTFPRYPLQQALPYNLYAGYSPYSPDYSYPTSYYNVYGTGMMGGAAAAAFYPYFQYGEGSGQYPHYHHHHLFQYPATGGYPQHYGAPISLAPTPAMQSSGMTMGLHAPVPMPHL